MVSEASWHSGIGRYGNAPSGAAPMDQQTVESLLRRLVQRVEESERRYSEALDELHARLDQLAQTTDAARAAGAPDDSATFDRLHDEVSSLTRRLEGEDSNPLDDFERLGRALSGDLNYAASLAGAPQPRPAGSAAPPSPRCRASTPPGACPLTSPCRMWITPARRRRRHPPSATASSNCVSPRWPTASRIPSARRCRRRSMP